MRLEGRKGASRGAPFAILRLLEQHPVRRVRWAAELADPPVPLNHMTCREFRQLQDAYVDDTLSGLDADRMSRHRQQCVQCARIDTRLRRALLVARNMPTIQPSAAFGPRLQVRLASERAVLQLATQRTGSASRWSWQALSLGTYSAIAAGVITIAGLAGAATFAITREAAVIRMVPVVATRPEAESSLTTPTMVASMPAGMPLWSAVLVAQQAPWHFAGDEASR